MRLRKTFLFYTLNLSLLVLLGCSKNTVVSTSNAEFREDLSAVRPRYTYVEPTVSKRPETENAPVKVAPKANNDKPSNGKPLNVNKKLETVLDTMSRQNKSIRYISGFRIQIYVGNVRQEADDAKSYIYQSFPDLTPYVSYSQPTYRVKAGDFMYRSDAEQYLEQIKNQYSSAVILADRVEIKKSLTLNPVAE